MFNWFKSHQIGFRVIPSVSSDFVLSCMRHSSRCLAVALCCVLSSFVHGQDVEEVIISVEQTENETLDDLVSVSAIDAEKLADAGIENVEDVAAYVPNLVLSETDVGTSIVIRGIGAGTNQGFDQSVGLYIDGVPYPRANMARAPFLDLSGVQVLRGPQYVLDGNYSIAGSVHLLTNSTLDELSAGIDVNYVPSQEDKKILLTAGLPMSDQFGIRLALQSQTSDGYIENVFRNENGPQKDDQIARLVFDFKPTESLSFKLKVEKGSYNRRGRQVEVILDKPSLDPTRTVTDPNEFSLGPGPNPSGLNGSNATFGQVITRDATIDRKSRDKLRSIFLTEADYTLRPFVPVFDAEAISLDPTGSGINQSQTYAFAGTSYLQNLASLYTTGRAYTRNGNGSVTEFFQPAPVPVGLLDTEVDFKRAADVEEFSNNDSINVTLNSELWLGEHQFNAVVSFVKYKFDEQIDGDFTSARLSRTVQSEEYSQDFLKLDYKSPTGGFAEFKAGASYLEGEVDFDTFSAFFLTDKPSVGTVQQRTDPSFSALEPIRAFAGQTQDLQDALRTIDGVGFSKLYSQDNKIWAAYVQAKLHWSDVFRTTIGLRYTWSEKCGIRDSAFTDSSDKRVPLQFSGVDLTDRQAREALFTQNLRLFGIQSHTDRYTFETLDEALAYTPDCRSEGPANPNPDLVDSVGNSVLDATGTVEAAIRGVRREEKVLPSITFEWDVSPSITTTASMRMANKLGGFDALSNTTPNLAFGQGGAQGTFEFEDENALSYELGIKWFHDYGELYATAFYTDYENLQISRKDGKEGENVDNAGLANASGIELEGNLQLTDNFSIDYSAAWIDFQFKEFLQGSCSLGNRADNFVITGAIVVPGIIRGDLLTRAFNGAVPIRYELDNFFIREFDDNGVLIATLDGTRTTGLVSQDGGRSLDPLISIRGFFTGRTDTLVFSDPSDELVYNEFVKEGIVLDDSRIAKFGDLIELRNFDNDSLVAAGFCDFSGKTNQYVAEWQGTFSFNYESGITGTDILFKPSLDVLYNSGYFTDISLDSEVAQEEYFQFNGRIALSDLDGIWEVALTGENLTDEKIVNYSAILPLGGVLTGSKGYYGFVRPPRTIGLNVRYNFY